MNSIQKAFMLISVNLDKLGGLLVLPAISIIVIVDVFKRYALNDPWIWSLEFNEWMLMLIFAFAIPECTRQNGHVRMELLIANLPKRSQETMDVVYVVCAISIFYLLGFHAWEEFLFDYELGRITEFVRLPIWGHHLAIFGMCVILIAYYLLRLIATIFNFSEFSRTESVGMEE
ncbi:MAG: TRAP transporter small permease [Alphaproteobacteria bacterium]|jgi:TRAP-type C4-dicarboxylate transport system permease small subunit|nr:TRAP transporter small permease [Alphaproteobacteria bacterium]